MRHLIALSLSAVLLAVPVSAQTVEPESEADSEIGEGVDLLGEGARMLLRGLIGEMEPALRDMARALQELEWNGLKIENLDDYHLPEVLPNGDIILRRKHDPLTEDPLPEGEIEL